MSTTVEKIKAIEDEVNKTYVALRCQPLSALSVADCRRLRVQPEEQGERELSGPS